MRITVNFQEKPAYNKEYLDLHKKFNLPLHGLTSEQTRFFHYAFRNEINVFFRTCDYSGDRIISQFSQNSPFKVYRHDIWWQKEFEIPEMDYNSKESFFTQFHKLQLKVPRMSIACDSTMENCPYVNCANHCKDCHMIFATGNCEDCHYCINTERSKTSMDASIAHECTLCYYITSCRTCYDVDFSAYCTDCSDSQFLYDCRRCRNCFLCVGLIGKEHCILNKQYNPEEYLQEISKFQPLTSFKIGDLFSQLQKLRDSYIHHYANIVGSENCTGNDISFSENCLNSYIIEYSRNCINGSSLRRCKDCLDFDLWGDPGELCYHSNSCGYNVYNLRMCFDCWNNCRFLTYCDSCPGCEECFGCVGIKYKKYCILNKQYSKADYEVLVDHIIENMKKNGEWGQFFTPYCSPHPLNNSMAHEYFYTDEKIAKELGFEWMDKTFEYQYDNSLLYKGPLQAIDIGFADIKSKFLLCSRTKLPFNIQARELEILQRKRLPLPDKHWRTRLFERDAMFMFPWKLQPRSTEDTGNILMSPVDSKYKIREKAIV